MNQTYYYKSIQKYYRYHVENRIYLDTWVKHAFKGCTQKKIILNLNCDTQFHELKQFARNKPGLHQWPGWWRAESLKWNAVWATRYTSPSWKCPTKMWGPTTRRDRWWFFIVTLGCFRCHLGFLKHNQTLTKERGAHHQVHLIFLHVLVTTKIPILGVSRGLIS